MPMGPKFAWLKENNKFHLLYNQNFIYYTVIMFKYGGICITKLNRVLYVGL